MVGERSRYILEPIWTTHLAIENISGITKGIWDPDRTLSTIHAENISYCRSSKWTLTKCFQRQFAVLMEWNTKTTLYRTSIYTYKVYFYPSLKSQQWQTGERISQGHRWQPSWGIHQKDEMYHNETWRETQYKILHRAYSTYFYTNTDKDKLKRISECRKCQHKNPPLHTACEHVSWYKNTGKASRITYKKLLQMTCH